MLRETSRRIRWVGLAWAGLGFALGLTVFVAFRFRRESERCGTGWSQNGARCCPEGQALVLGECVGQPLACPAPLILAEGGCVAAGDPVLIPSGTLELGPTDWDVSTTQREVFPIAAFRLDPFEVTTVRYRACMQAGQCASVPLTSEPGRPVTQISGQDAERYCHSVGGRLPTELEWLYAASRGGRARYPWGAHGLVCRRAVFGMVQGPCATGATGPELAGSRPAGRTPSGIYDLAGNVAEWSMRVDASLVAMGGSYRSLVASSLKAWSARETANEPAMDVGFRCAYGAENGSE